MVSLSNQHTVEPFKSELIQIDKHVRIIEVFGLERFSLLMTQAFLFVNFTS